MFVHVPGGSKSSDYGDDLVGSRIPWSKPRRNKHIDLSVGDGNDSEEVSEDEAANAAVDLDID